MLSNWWNSIAVTQSPILLILNSLALVEPVLVAWNQAKVPEKVAASVKIATPVEATIVPILLPLIFMILVNKNPVTFLRQLAIFLIKTL